MRILDDTYVAAPSQWCWRPEWLTGYDSAFGLLMKFAFLNAMTAKDMAAEFVSRSCGKRTAILRKAHADLRDPQLFDHVGLASAMRTDTATVSAGFLGSDFPDFNASSSDLKWCDVCMAWGLHLSVTQMHAVSQCPIHNLALRSRCAQCEAVIPYALSARAFDCPFQCPDCQVDLAPRLRNARSWVPGLRPEHIGRINMMRKYVTGYASLIRGSQPVPTMTGQCAGLRLPGAGEQRAPGYVNFIGQVVDEMASPDGQYCLPLVPVSRACCGFGLAGEQRMHERCDAEDGRFLTGDEMVVAVRVYRAIKRRIWHQIGAHRRCVTAACRHIWWDMRGAKTSAFCGTAAPYIRWRMLWEGCGTPRYLDADRDCRYYGILGWLQARPAPYPDEWANARKAWMLAHIFSSVCLASYDALREETTEEGELVWDARTTTPNATTHWVLADAAAGTAAPVIFTPLHGLLNGAGQHPAGGAHRSWHANRLAEIRP